MAFKKAKFGDGNPYWNEHELQRVATLDRPALDHLQTNIHNVGTFSNTVYGGQFYHLTNSSHINTINLSYTDTETTRIGTSPTTNSGFGGFIPENIRVVRSALLLCYYVLTIPGEKVQSNTEASGEGFFSFIVDTTPLTQNLMFYDIIYSQSQDADNQQLKHLGSTLCVVPVVYDSGDPYITTNTRLIFQNMTSENATYNLSVAYKLMGIFV